MRGSVGPGVGMDSPILSLDNGIGAPDDGRGPLKRKLPHFLHGFYQRGDLDFGGHEEGGCRGLIRQRGHGCGRVVAAGELSHDPIPTRGAGRRDQGEHGHTG